MIKHKAFSIAAALFLALSAVMIPAGAVAASADGATVTLSVDTESFAADQPVIIHVKIANPTNHSMRVLKWHTPADEMEGPLFSIQRDYGVPVAYIGPFYKRPAPTDEDYIHLKAGESITNDVDIALFYDLAVSGSYSIIYDTSSLNLYSEKDNGNREAPRLTSNEINVWIDGRDSGASLYETPPAEVAGTTSFNRCTTSQQVTLFSARSQAGIYSADALSYLNKGNHDSGPRYTTWFGVNDASRYSTVTSHFSSISNAMDNASVMFDCGCKKKYYAYVYANRPYIIYLCRVFWSAPPTGTDSQAGTLIHEMSHFNVVASTLDYVYGQTGAKSLAITSPAKAVNNADNHEYFSENTPPLP